MSANKPIPAMYQGVSQQPAAIRALEQCEASENGYMTVADGDRKRPPTTYVKLMAATTPNNVKVHQYFRGDGEHNVVTIWQNTCRVFDGVTGTEKTVDTTTFANVLNYLDSTNSIKDIGALTVADTTFLWNRKKVPAMTSATASAQNPKLFIYIKGGQPNTVYTVQLSSNIITYTTTASSVTDQRTSVIASTMAASITAIAGGAWTAVSYGPLIVASRVDNADFAFDWSDTFGNSLMSVFKNRVERYSDLPRTFVEGITVEVRGQGDSGGKSSFWVTFKTTGGFNTGYWEETLKPDSSEKTTIDAATMPLALVRLSDGTFQLQRITWNARLVGSTATTCPLPSFIGRTINAMTFHRSRLGILAGENACFSRASSLYNFWPKASSVVSDDDPIDITANGTKVSTLRHAVPFQRQLMLFSDNAQFPLTGGETLTGRNARLDPATEFDCLASVTPVSSGQDLFFFFERSSPTGGAAFGGVREYFVNQSSVTNEAVEVTAHVPQYIPSGIVSAFVSSTENLLLLVSENAYNYVYWYKYLWDGDKRVQSAWGRWQFRTSADGLSIDKILSAAVDKTTVTLVVQRFSGIHLEKMNLQSTATTGTLPFQIHLDSLRDTTGLTTSYLAQSDTTFIGVDANTAFEGTENQQFVAGPLWGDKAGSIIPFTMNIGGTQWTLKGNWTAHPLHYGRKYTHRHTFSEFFERDTNGLAMQQGRLQVKHVTVGFKNAVTFTAEVATPGRDTAVYRYSSLQLGIFGTVIGTPVMRSGAWTFPVASDSKRATVTLVNDSPYPATFHSAEHEGLFSTRTQRK